MNACHDIGRQRRRRRDETDLSAEEPARRLRHARGPTPRCGWRWRGPLSRLRPRPREVFVLYEVEGFLHREIAEILDIPEGTSKALLFEAQRHLRAALGAGGRA